MSCMLLWVGVEDEDIGEVAEEERVLEGWRVVERRRDDLWSRSHVDAGE